MSQKRSKRNVPEVRPPKTNNGGKKPIKNTDNLKFRENVIRKLYDSFQGSSDLALIASVAHTCQWDINRSTEALMMLSGRKNAKKNKPAKGERKDGTKNKAKSLPGTLKPEKSVNGKGMGSSSNPTHCSTNSLSSGQVWQRHYKSKPQSPGLLTMIPPRSKEIVKLKAKPESCIMEPKPVKQSTTELKKTNAIIKRIQHLVHSGVKVMILMRGVPGSGKTHLAQIIVSLVTGNELSEHIFSTDDYFIQLGRGNYAYDYNQLAQAHNWNQKRVSEALKRKINPVVVDNTHTQSWEMQPYVMMAVEHWYHIEVLEPATEWKMKEAELAKRNIHSVPREKIRQMLERYEIGWTGEKLLKSFGLKYKHPGLNSAEPVQENRAPTNLLLAQHRQHSVIDQPEKPKRKRNGPKKKDRHLLAGIEITEDREKQLEELNKLFAEYGKTMDPVSKMKVLESGVPIPEVVSRMRKLQGNILPLPKSNVPPTIPEAEQPSPVVEENVTKTEPNYLAPRRDSFSESLEPDTMSSSNASETSECETDTDVELPQWKEMRKYFEYSCPGHFVDGEDLLEDYDDEDEENRIKSEGAVGGKSPKSNVTSSQEELSLIDFTSSVTPASYSQEDLSLLNFDGTESPNARDSSSSSEEQETQMLTLQESLREVLIDDRRMIEIDTQRTAKEGPNESDNSKQAEVELSDSLIDVIGKRYEKSESSPKINVEGEGVKEISLNESLLEMLVKKYSQEDSEGVGATETKPEVNVLECKKSPDLEEVPLPSIPSKPEENKLKTDETDRSGAKKKDRFEDIVSTWEHPPEPEIKDTSPKPARPKNALLGAIKKSGIQRDKSPEELLRSIELSWSSIPFTSSWEDVSKKPVEQDATGPKPQRKAKTDTSTNTILTDFELWKKDDTGIVKLEAMSRNINENLKEPSIPVNYVTETLMLDKGTMTVDAEELDATEKNNAVDKLAGMFPGISREHLSDILDKCKGNILWAVELLLESSDQLEGLPECPEPATTEENPPSYDEAKAMSEVEFTPMQTIICDGKKTIKRRKDRKSGTSELSQLLKKQIEDSIHINENLYHEKTLFLKKLRHGEIEFGDGPIEPVGETSGEQEPVPEPEVTDEDDEEDEEEEEEEEETIPMKIDPEFFKNLAKHFGSSDAANNEKQAALVPVINVPMSLAQQIYNCWLENVNRQLEEMQSDYDKMLKDDELLASALQKEEFDSKQPDLREIMDMELAWLLYKQDQAQLQEQTRETMATKLSKQILFEAYPNMDKTMLLDLYQSEGNSFQRTVEVLNAQENQSPTTVVAPEFLAAHKNKLLERAISEQLKKKSDTGKKPIVIVKQKATEKEAPENKDLLVVNPAEFRQNTALLHQQRNECCRLAQEAFKKKSYSVASYFSHLASLYKEKIREMAKEPFPSTLFEEKKNEVSTTVDLHFLFVTEALQILDLFLDHHLTELSKKITMETVTLYLITGRGRHSNQGISKIKPAVKKRLGERRLSYSEVNPGMLKVTIRKGDLLSHQL